VPAYQIFEDIERRLDKKVEMSVRRSTETQYMPPYDRNLFTKQASIIDSCPGPGAIFLLSGELIDL